MSEMALTAEHVIVIGRGRLLADTSVADLVAGASATAVRVRTPQAPRLAAVLAGPDVAVEAVAPDVLQVRGLPSSRIGEVALAEQVVLYELTPLQASLEEAFMEMTADEVEFTADTVPGPGVTAGSHSGGGRP